MLTVRFLKNHSNQQNTLKAKFHHRLEKEVKHLSPRLVSERLDSDLTRQELPPTTDANGAKRKKLMSWGN